MEATQAQDMALELEEAEVSFGILVRLFLQILTLIQLAEMPVPMAPPLVALRLVELGQPETIINLLYQHS
jgi:hypothetical protein